MANQTNSSIELLRRNLVTGGFESQQIVTEGDLGVRGIQGVSALALSQDGKFLYAAGADSETLAVFRREADGTLSWVQALRNRSGVGLGTPSSILVHPDGTIYVSSSSGIGASVGGVAVFRQVDVNGDGVVNTLDQVEPAEFNISFEQMNELSVTTGGQNDLAQMLNGGDANQTNIITGDGRDEVSLISISGSRCCGH